MKLLIATTADQNIKDMTDITHPVIKKFAKEWNADFRILSKDTDCPGTGSYEYRTFEIYTLLDEYDRVLHLDSDVLINKTCPNIFEIVPFDKIGTIYEDKGSRIANRYERIELIQKKFGDVGWKSGYINSGCLLTSRIHKNIFQKINGQYYTELGYNDALEGYNIHKNHFEVYELPFQFNHMTMFSEEWNGFANRFDSYIIHYAGRGIFDKKDIFKKKIKTRVQQIKSDYLRFYGEQTRK